ncbi:MAG: 1-acyl-sn-glycerol-3-phosphate acyltransferase [Solirubrobacteraceae bacterium]
MDLDVHHRRARERGVNPILYWLVRAVLQPAFHLYFRLSRIGREHIPQEGPVILAANHRSFLDPFVIGTCLRRPVYYVAKQELFRQRLTGWILGSLGAFPVARGAGDAEMLTSAKAILARGDCVVIFPEGTRVRPGPLRAARRGVGRLALETGAPVVPVAVIGSEGIRRGWRIRPRKVRIRVGRALRFPVVEEASPQLAQAVTDRIWPCVELQWEWLGGITPHRRAAVAGSGTEADALATLLAGTGIATRRVAERDETDLAETDLLVLALPATELPGALAAHAAGLPAGASVLVAARGLVPAGSELPAAAVAEALPDAHVLVLGGPAGAGLLEHGASVVLAGRERAVRRRLADVLTAAGCDVNESSDVIGVELGRVATGAAALAASLAASAGPNAAGAAAGKVLAELCAYGAVCGAQPETLAGLAGAGDLVAAVIARPVDGERAEAAAAAVPLLADRLAEAGVPAPALDGLRDLVEGRIEADAWAAALTRPARGRGRVRAAA